MKRGIRWAAFWLAALLCAAPVQAAEASTEIVISEIYIIVEAEAEESDSFAAVL